jgi:hypothetical protein
MLNKILLGLGVTLAIAALVFQIYIMFTGG